MYRTKFTVTGSMAFPLDMLRYDACFPYDSESVANMDEARGRRSVQLVRYSKYKPTEPVTVGRWESFLWYVSDVTIGKVV